MLAVNMLSITQEAFISRLANFYKIQNTKFPFSLYKVSLTLQIWTNFPFSTLVKPMWIKMYWIVNRRISCSIQHWLLFSKNLQNQTSEHVHGSMKLDEKCGVFNLFCVVHSCFLVGVCTAHICHHGRQQCQSNLLFPQSKVYPESISCKNTPAPTPKTLCTPSWTRQPKDQLRQYWFCCFVNRQFW